MKAIEVVGERYDLGDDVVAELAIWEVSPPVRGSIHSYKYRLALIAHDVCVLRYDNEAGKGDHRHVGARQFPYVFIDRWELESDFWQEVAEWLRRNAS